MREVRKNHFFPRSVDFGFLSDTEKTTFASPETAWPAVSEKRTGRSKEDGHVCCERSDPEGTPGKGLAGQAPLSLKGRDPMQARNYEKVNESPREPPLKEQGI